MNNEGKQGAAPDELVAFAGWYKIEWPPLPDDVEFFWWREFCVSAWDSAFGPPPVSTPAQPSPSGEPYFVGMLNSQYAIVGCTSDGDRLDLRVIGAGAKDGKTLLLVELPTAQPVAWAVVSNSAGIHKLSIGKESAERKAAVWAEEWPGNGAHVRPLIFGAVAPPPATAQPVAAQPLAYIVDWADIGEGTARSLYYEENAKQYMQDAVDYGQSIGRAANVTPLYTAPPPAPIAAPSPKGQP